MIFNNKSFRYSDRVILVLFLSLKLLLFRMRKIMIIKILIMNWEL